MLCLWSKLSYCFWNGLKCFWILFFSELWGGWLEFTSVQLVEALVLSCLTPDNHRGDRFYSYLNIRTLANRISYFTSYESRLVFEILTSLQYGSHWRFFYDSEWFQKIIAWLVWNTNIWNPWSTFERGDKTIGKMSAKMTKSLSIMVFPNYQDESSVVRSRERCTGETSRHRRCLDECFVWRELPVLSFNPFSFLSAVFFLYLLKKGHYCCLVGLKPLRNPESKPQPKTLSSIWWIWGETYIKFYQTTYCHRIW